VKQYARNILLALDRLTAALLGRSGLRTVSQEAEADRQAGAAWATWICRQLGFLGKHHCEESMIGDSTARSLWGATGENACAD
jgi:hypothetical protein